MARTYKKVRFLPKGKQKHTEASAAKGVEEVLRILEGRWKLVILFHLFGGKVRRFSELRRAIPAVSEKMLIQQLRQMERDGVVHDEGGSFTGRAAIEQWNTTARAKYHHTVVPLSATERDGATVVIGRVSGEFPGSPVELHHAFRIDGEQIVSLEIR